MFLVFITGTENQRFLGIIADLICFIKRIFETFRKYFKDFFVSIFVEKILQGFTAEDWI